MLADGCRVGLLWHIKMFKIYMKKVLPSYSRSTGESRMDSRRLDKRILYNVSVRVKF